MKNSSLRANSVLASTKEGSLSHVRVPCVYRCKLSDGTNERTRVRHQV